MDAYKQHKENESKVHEDLFNNLLLLSGFYATTNEFEAIFCKNMFVKNNKAAFFEVIYYLLNILDPEAAKKRLLHWPPFDLKREAKFRTEVVTFVNTLNSTYDNADIPVCQPSSLISPGGFRFAKFMLKISQLVIYEHLKKSDELQYNLAFRIKPHKTMSAITNAQTAHLAKEVGLIEHETNDMLVDFNKLFEEANVRSKLIENELGHINQKIANSKKLLEETQLEFNKKYPSYPSLESLEEKLEGLKVQVEKLVELEHMFESSDKLLRYISDSIRLEHNEEKLSVPDDVAHIIGNKKELNLAQFFQALAILLEKKALQLQSPTTTFMQETKENINNFTIKFENTLKQLQLKQENFNNILDELRAFSHELTEPEII